MQSLNDHFRSLCENTVSDIMPQTGPGRWKCKHIDTRIILEEGNKCSMYDSVSTVDAMNKAFPKGLLSLKDDSEKSHEAWKLMRKKFENLESLGLITQVNDGYYYTTLIGRHWMKYDKFKAAMIVLEDFDSITHPNP